MNSNNLSEKEIKKILKEGYIVLINDKDTSTTKNKIKVFSENKLDMIEEFEDIDIIKMYKLIGNKKIEWYYSDLIFMCWDRILSIYNSKCDYNQKNVLDFAYSYIGMGHIYVYFIDLRTNNIYKRRDGGSNGYEREDRFVEICKEKIPFTEYEQYSNLRDILLEKDKLSFNSDS